MKNIEIEDFDYIILGTGLSETAISFILSKNKNLKILQIDKNSTYGSEFSTYSYNQIVNYFKNKDTENININYCNNFNDNKNYSGNDNKTNNDSNGSFNESCNNTNSLISVVNSNHGLMKDFKIDNKVNLFSISDKFNIDITPKLLLRESKMKNFLLKNEIDEMVVFNSIASSYVFTNNYYHIPISEVDALKSSLIPFFEKYKVIKFFWNVRSFAKDKANFKKTMREEFQYYNISKDTISLLGSAIALNLNDDYLDLDPKITYQKILDYILSIINYENVKSPYIYPIYGLSEICQAFARKSAINGTVFMLKADIININKNLIKVLDPNGKMHLFRANKKIISDPRYFSSKVDKEIIRCILIVQNNNNISRNIIYCKKFFNRKNDIFCVCLNFEEKVCPEGFEIVILSTVKETEDPHKEIEPVIKKFNYINYFYEIRKVYVNEDTENVIFTKNVDESAVMDNIYDDIESVLYKLGVKI